VKPGEAPGERPTFSLPVRVYYQDTDAGGVVYHAAYVNFLERARTEWLRKLGFDHRALVGTFGIVFMVHAMEVRYLKPAFMDDTLVIELALRRLGASRLELEQRVLREATTLVEAQVKIACVSIGSFKPVRIPDPIRRKIEE
jgi:acyl-CoA thioester hydrolase